MVREGERGREPARPVNGSRCGREKERRAVSLAWQPGGYRAVFNRGLFRSPEAKPGSGLDPLRVSTCGLQRRGAVLSAGAVFPEFRGKRSGVVSSQVVFILSSFQISLKAVLALWIYNLSSKQKLIIGAQHTG